MVNELNHIFDCKKIGHTGTLDPLATGILVMCGGKYTKLINRLSFLEKEYIAEIKVGVKTDTLDITGSIVEKRECTFDKDSLVKVLKEMKGIYKQEIPAYSAKKVNGKKLYEYARANLEVPKIYNEVEIKNIELLNIQKDIITIKLLVSKGTYIRSIIQTICDKLKIIGTMNNLIRTKQGPFSLEESYSIEDIKNGNYSFVDVEKVLKIPVYHLNDEEYSKVKNGNMFELKSKEKELLLKYKGNIIAIYELGDDIYYKPSIMLY
jgi:tRNA pseudouridine55 synthase